MATLSNYPSPAIIYIGCVVPDEPEFQNEAFSRAGNMFQDELLHSLCKAGLTPVGVLSQQQQRAFPHAYSIATPTREVKLSRSKLSANLLPFINLPFVRPITVGLAVLWNVWRQSQQMPGYRCKVLYAFNLTEPPGLFTLLAARLFGALAVASINDINIPGEQVPKSLSRRLDFWLHKQLLPRFDGLVVVSQSITEDFAPSVPHIVISGGLNDMERVRYMNVGDPSTQPVHPFTIVSAGRLSETNGFLELLRAFELLADRPYRLRIAGAGPLEPEIRLASERDSRIDFIGFLPFDQVLELYQTADVLVNMRLTQRQNTRYFFPSKTFEYLASGVPVITTRTGHIEAEYGEFTYLLREETPEALAQLIDEVAQQPEEMRLAKGRAAQRHVFANNHWDVQGRKIADFIRSLCLSCTT
jgi:glycosyltransferase involved in cell wall biosynthesis